MVLSNIIRQALDAIPITVTSHRYTEVFVLFDRDKECYKFCRDKLQINLYVFDHPDYYFLSTINCEVSPQYYLQLIEIFQYL